MRGHGPPADVGVDLALVRALVCEQHPDLAALPLGQVYGGWDNVTVRLGSELAVRLPRRELGARLHDSEVRWLPLLAPRLPLAVPLPVRTGEPGCGYPWRWSICTWVPGRSALAKAPAREDAAAAGIAEFLQALHQPAPTKAPTNPYRGVPLAARDADVRRLLATIAASAPAVGTSTEGGARPQGNADTRGGSGAVGHMNSRLLARHWQSSLNAPAYADPPVWVHGDLHPGNLIVAGGEVTGVIDFGDVCAGDPAVDYAVAWMMLNAEARQVLRQQAGADEATWTRARGWAVLLGLVMATAGAGPFADLGRRTLVQVLEPD